MGKGEREAERRSCTSPLSPSPSPFLPFRLSARHADAIVNPKFQPDDDPLRTLPGVGVAYKLMQQLYTLAGRRFEEHDLLDLVALGIVADVAEQCMTPAICCNWDSSSSNARGAPGSWRSWT
ncbi:MAG: hypothetical protein R2911_29860 [Caldilineaceae bacterium]